MNCKNCGHRTKSNFCPQCGQSTNVEKLTLSNFLADIFSSIFQVNRGFLYSLKELFIRPGHSIREYLNGRRKNHFKPVAYAFTFSTIYFILSQFTKQGTFINEAIEGFYNYPDSSKEGNQFKILNWLAKNFAFTMLMLLPLTSLASFIAFLNTGFNYIEHFVLNAYITGQQAFLYTISIILGFLTNFYDCWISVIFFISVAYTFYVFFQFFTQQSRIEVFFRTIVTYFLYGIIIIPALVLIFSNSQSLLQFLN